jgi:hypothetical protein
MVNIQICLTYNYFIADRTIVIKIFNKNLFIRNKIKTIKMTLF